MITEEHYELDILVKLISEIQFTDLQVAAEKAGVSVPEVLDIVDKHIHD
ncbi:hypothetical protein [Paenibacillus xylanexedens]|nr:hypothetical protein [Paenibacillus xylanexedens]RPK20091.1 hypothetical protein EDO6_06630 [Paenibacillus xylanexedens]